MGWNVAKFMHEWVQYHAWLGVDHFFLYDNNSDDDISPEARFLSRSVPRSRFPPQRPQEASGQEHVGVSVRPWPWLKTQQAGFSHCVLEAGPKCEWIMFTDVDEFVFPKFVSELKTKEALQADLARKGPFLSFLLDWSQRSACPAPMGQWQIESLLFGPSHQKTHPKDGVALGYTCRVAYHGDLKVIIRPQATRAELTHWIHLFGLGAGYQSEPRSPELAILYHYKFQAWDEYKTKFARRVAGGVGDWKKVYRPGQTQRSDGVVIRDGVAHPPPDWPERYCEVPDSTLAKLVRMALGKRDEAGRQVFPWQER